MLIYLYSNIVEADKVYPSNPVLSFYYKLYVKIANKYEFLKNEKLYNTAYNYNKNTFYHHFFYNNIIDEYVFLSVNNPYIIAEFTIRNTIIHEKISDEYYSENLKYCRVVVMNKILESI